MVRFKCLWHIKCRILSTVSFVIATLGNGGHLCSPQQQSVALNNRTYQSDFPRQARLKKEEAKEKQQLALTTTLDQEEQDTHHAVRITQEEEEEEEEEEEGILCSFYHTVSLLYVVYFVHWLEVCFEKKCFEEEIEGVLYTGNFRQQKISSKATVRHFVRNLFSSNAGRRSFALRSFVRRSFAFRWSSHSWIVLIPHLWFCEKFSQEFNLVKNCFDKSDEIKFLTKISCYRVEEEERVHQAVLLHERSSQARTC